MKNPSQFTPAQRLHISLDVRNLEASAAFYQTLFGTPLAKRRDDYAKLEAAEPALNLALNQVGDSPSTESRVSHFGIQVQTQEAVQEAADRLKEAGLVTANEEQVTCCYAVQDKVWATDPDGNAWEIFVVTDKEAAVHSDRASGPDKSCCPGETASGCC